MLRARALLPLLALVAPGCTSGAPSGFTSTTNASQATNPQTSFTSGAGTTDPTATGTTTGEPTTGTSDPTTSTTEPATSSTSTSSSTTSSTTSSTSTDTETTGGICGDGVLDPGEVCDDGNRDDGDACRPDCTSGQALLVLAGRGVDVTLAARYVPGNGWSLGELPESLGEVKLVPTPAGALAAGRRFDVDPDLSDELLFATWSSDQPDDWSDLAPVGDFGFAIDGPGLAAVGADVTLAFLGTDYKHYTALYTGGAFGPFLPLPAAMPPDQAFGPSAAVLAAGLAETYAVYAGDDSKVYFNFKPTPGAAWQPSLQAPPPVVVSALTPAALVDPSGDLLIAYVRQVDGKIAVTKLLTPQNAWTLETIVHDQAIAGSELAFVRTDGGAYYIAWKGYDNHGIYAVRGLDHDEWNTPFTVDEPPSITLPPALAPGTPGADAELVYVTGGVLRHVRLVGDTPSAPADIPGTADLGRPGAARVAWTE